MARDEIEYDDIDDEDLDAEIEKEKSASTEPGKSKYCLLVVCLDCHHRWLQIVPQKTNLFELECAACGSDSSFPSFIPPAYSEGSI